MKNILFATCYCGKPEYLERYRKYLNYYLPKLNKLGAEKIILIDDGSPLEILSKLNIPIIELDKLPRGTFPLLKEKAYIFRFPDNLGRHAGVIIPGWWRSFSYAGCLAKIYGLTKMIHIESDTYILSDRMFKYIKEQNEGWTVPFCHHEDYPETCIQIINEFSAFNYYEPGKEKENFKMLFYYFRRGEMFWFKGNVGDFNYIPGMTLPFDRINRDFVGDRYGEDGWETIPEGIDYIANISDVSKSWRYTKLNTKREAITKLLDIPSPKGEGLTGFHSGDMGDVIYCIPVMRSLGITKLYLNPLPWYGTKMGLKQIDILKPLLESQGFEVIIPEPDDKIHIDYDLDMARNIGQDYDNQHLSVIQANPFLDNVKIRLTTSWLKVNKRHIADIIINRSARYQSPAMDYKALLKDVNASIAFVGLKDEYEAFIKESGMTEIGYQPTKDFQELAEIIAGTKLFMGNQSSPFSIAEGMKVPRMQETCDWDPNCLPEGGECFSIKKKNDLKNARKFVVKIIGE